MIKKFEDYLKKELSMGKAFVKRVDEIINIYSGFMVEPFAEIFVSEYIEKDKERKYETLVLFTNNFICEVEQFLHGPTLWTARSFNEFPYVEISYSDYDFKNSTDATRLVFKIHGKDTYQLILKASGSNCDKLRILMKKLYYNPKN